LRICAGASITRDGKGFPLFPADLQVKEIFDNSNLVHDLEHLCFGRRKLTHLRQLAIGFDADLEQLQIDIPHQLVGNSPVIGRPRRIFRHTSLGSQCRRRQ
jgi:hypothetical protein